MRRSWEYIGLPTPENWVLDVFWETVILYVLHAAPFRVAHSI